MRLLEKSVQIEGKPKLVYENHADIIVFEYLKTKGKISGRKKQRLHLWRKRDIQKRCEHQAHRNG